MKRFLILAVVLAACTAFGQSTIEPEHAPTSAQCEADARLWGQALAEKINYEKQPQSVEFSTEADQTSTTEWVKRWVEMANCVNLQTDSHDATTWPAITKAGIERRIFSERLLSYIASSQAHKADYEKWETAKQAKARQKAAGK